MKKTGASLRNKQVKVKNLATEKKYGPTTPCRAKNCKCCEVVTDQDHFEINGKLVKAANGKCNSYNVIYLVICKLCNKSYIGRSTRFLRTRISEHRQKFYQILKGTKIDPFDDNFSLGIHLSEHKLCNPSDFNDTYRVCIVDNCSPRVIDIKEHKFIHILNTLRPNGLNVSNPFSITKF